MKKGKTDKKIGEVINSIVSKNDLLGKKYKNFEIDRIWRNELGDTISKYTSSVRLDNQVLYVTITSAALKHELTVRKEQLIKKLNHHLSLDRIKNIVIK